MECLFSCLNICCFILVSSQGREVGFSWARFFVGESHVLVRSVHIFCLFRGRFSNDFTGP